jgi:hypothetical protein
VAALAAASFPARAAAFQEPVPGGTGAAPETDSLEAWIWLDRGDEPVLEEGEEVRVYYRVSDDANVAIFRVDTEGRVSMVFPQHPEADTWTVGGRDYRLLLPESRTWDVTDAPGEGAFFVVASREPLDFGLFDFDAERGWDLTTAGAEAYDDTYQAIDDHVLAILPDWETASYALNLLPYEVVEAGSRSRVGDDVIVLRSGRRVTYVPASRRPAYVPTRSGPHVRLFIRFGPLPVFGARVHYGPPPLRTWGYRAPPPRVRPAPAYRPRYSPPPPRYAPPVRTPRRVRPGPPRRPAVTSPSRAPARAPARAPVRRPAVSRRRPGGTVAAPRSPSARRSPPAASPSVRRSAPARRASGRRPGG